MVPEQSIRVLLFILNITVLVSFPFSIAMAEGRHRDEFSAVRLVVMKVTRLGPKAVEVSLGVTNTSKETIFIPSFEVTGSTKLATLRVMYYDPHKQWATLGPFYDIPADAATTVQAGQTFSTIHDIPDPCIVVFPGKLIPHYKISPTPLGGKYKITVGYYGSEEDWNRDLEVLRSKKMPKEFPQLHYAESEEFTIPTR
jgi:hypothetical protein